MLIDLENNKKYHFGAKNYEDFTITGDVEQKNRYLKRHQKESPNWTFTLENLVKPSFLSRFILWNKPTIRASVNYIEQHLPIDVSVNV